MKNYFKYVPMWLCVITNIILGLGASFTIMMSALFFFGMFETPSVRERIIGVLILLGTVAIILVVNYILYRICRKNKKESKSDVGKKGTCIRFVVILLIIVILGFSFFISGDLWAWLNGWWY